VPREPYAFVFVGFPFGLNARDGRFVLNERQVCRQAARAGPKRHLFHSCIRNAFNRSVLASERHGEQSVGNRPYFRIWKQ